MFIALQHYATGRRVAWLFIITMGVYGTMMLYSVPLVMAHAPEQVLLDLLPGGYDHATVETLFHAIGATGRTAYLTRQLPIDCLYPALFAVTYTLMLIWLFKKRFAATSKVFILAGVPVMVALFDYLENIGIWMLLRAFPEVDDAIVQMTSCFTMLKSGFVLFFFLLLFVGGVMLCVKRNPHHKEELS